MKFHVAIIKDGELRLTVEHLETARRRENAGNGKRKGSWAMYEPKRHSAGRIRKRSACSIEE